MAESFISSMSLMVAAFFVSVLMRQSIPYPGSAPCLSFIQRSCSSSQLETS